MKKNKIILILVSCFALTACQTVKDGLSGNKGDNSDEFLVKKKAPLVLPPNFEQLPEPGVSPSEDTTLNILSIEEIIRQSRSNDTSTETSSSNSSIEKSIIEKINKQ